MTTIINGSSPSITFSDGSAQTSATRPFQNRIINGAMVIDQRNAGASITPSNTGGFMTDRWVYYASQASKFTAQQVTTAPAGFTNSLKMTVASAVTVGASDYFLPQQFIEGFNVGDLGWGTANAKTVTLSFQVYSSLTGTFGGSLRNEGDNRCYPFTYTISSANTWTPISVTIAGDTSGGWNVTNGIGIKVCFSLGAGSTVSGTAGAWATGPFYSATGAVSVVGTAGATWFVTGVQLEVGSTATSFDYRPYGTELSLCERYCRRYGDGLTGIAANVNGVFLCPFFLSPMRVAPTVIFSDTSIKITDNYASDYTSSGSTVTTVEVSAFGGRIFVNGFGTLTQGRVYQTYGNTDGYFLVLSAEL